MSMLNQRGRDDIATKILRAITMKGGDISTALTEPKDREYFDRLVFLDNLMRRHFPALTTHQVYKLYKARYPDVASKSVYHNDRKNAERVFGSLASHNKDYKRAIYVEWLENVHSLAMKNGDYKAAERALNTAAQILQLHLPDKADEFEDRPTKFEIHVNIKLPDGKSGKKVINIDDFQSMSPMELKAITEVIDQPRVDLEDMSRLLSDTSDE